MPKINVPKNRNSRPYWPKELYDEGYIGNLNATPNACVVVIPKPGAKHKDVAKSLEILAQDYNHRANIEK